MAYAWFCEAWGTFGVRGFLAARPGVVAVGRVACGLWVFWGRPALRGAPWHWPAGTARAQPACWFGARGSGATFAGAVTLSRLVWVPRAAWQYPGVPERGSGGSKLK